MSTEPLRGSDAMSVRELADIRGEGKEHTVLDVREARELDVCRLEGALHIPMADVPARTDDLPTDQLLVVMCHHGARSQMVVDFLRNAGFDNAVNLDGGIDAWACDIDQSTPLSIAASKREIATMSLTDSMEKPLAAERTGPQIAVFSTATRACRRRFTRVSRRPRYPNRIWSVSMPGPRA